MSPCACRPSRRSSSRLRSRTRRALWPSIACYRVYVEHVIGKLKNWSGLFNRAAMRFYRMTGGDALDGLRNERLFVAAALYNADLLEGAPLQRHLGSAICEALRNSIVRPDTVSALPKAVRQRLNSVPKIEWDWVLRAFNVDVTRAKSNLLSKAWRSVLGGSVCGLRFGDDGRNSPVVSIGAVVLPSMKQGVHYCYVVFDALRLRGAFCTCKNGFSRPGDPTAAAGRAEEVARCRHVLATVLALGLAQDSLRDAVPHVHSRLKLRILSKRDMVNVRYVCSSSCVWPPRVECLKMGLEDAQAVAMDARARGGAARSAVRWRLDNHEHGTAFSPGSDGLVKTDTLVTAVLRLLKDEATRARGAAPGARNRAAAQGHRRNACVAASHTSRPRRRREACSRGVTSHVRALQFGLL